MRNKSVIVILIIVLSVVLLLVGGVVISKRFSFIPDNDPSLVGNTGGNLNNGGYFCEDLANGKVYFANQYDNGYLYSMNTDKTELKKLYNSKCSNICIGGEHLYFAMQTPEGGTGLGFVIKTAGIYRSPIKGGKAECLTLDECVAMNLIGNNIYYQTSTGKGVGLKRIEIHGDEESEIIEDSFVINPACAIDGKIYYGGTAKDHYLYAFDVGTRTATALWNGNVWNPVWYDNYFYYMDISEKYKICRYSPATQTVEILTHDRVDNFNVGYGYIFYNVSVGDNPGLYKMQTNGSGRQQIFPGYVCDINITSLYTYFRGFGSDTPVYCVPTSGGSVMEFKEAEEAAIKNNK